jgi:hypothetical protein
MYPGALILAPYAVILRQFPPELESFEDTHNAAFPTDRLALS